MESNSVRLAKMRVQTTLCFQICHNLFGSALIARKWETAPPQIRPFWLLRYRCFAHLYFGLGRGPIIPPGPAMGLMDRKDLNSNKNKTIKRIALSHFFQRLSSCCPRCPFQKLTFFFASPSPSPLPCTGPIPSFPITSVLFRPALPLSPLSHIILDFLSPASLFSDP